MGGYAFGVRAPSSGEYFLTTSLLGYWSQATTGSFGGYDERELERTVAESYPSRRDIIAIGSSKHRQLRK